MRRKTKAQSNIDKYIASKVPTKLLATQVSQELWDKTNQQRIKDSITWRTLLEASMKLYIEERS